MTYTPIQALRHLRQMATKAVPNCVNLDAIDRVVAATTFTEASTEEALLILDDAMACDDICEADLRNAIDFAIQKLRPVPAPVHDEAALAQLAEKYPIELPWMQQHRATAAAGAAPEAGGVVTPGRMIDWDIRLKTWEAEMQQRDNDCDAGDKNGRSDHNYREFLRQHGPTWLQEARRLHTELAKTRAALMPAEDAEETAAIQRYVESHMHPAADWDLRTADYYDSAATHFDRASKNNRALAKAVRAANLRAALTPAPAHCSCPVAQGLPVCGGKCEKGGEGA